jgi:hypothetical protein
VRVIAPVDESRQDSEAAAEQAALDFAAKMYPFLGSYLPS